MEHVVLRLLLPDNSIIVAAPKTGLLTLRVYAQDNPDLGLKNIPLETWMPEEYEGRARVVVRDPVLRLASLYMHWMHPQIGPHKLKQFVAGEISAGWPDAKAPTLFIAAMQQFVDQYGWITGSSEHYLNWLEHFLPTGIQLDEPHYRSQTATYDFADVLEYIPTPLLSKRLLELCGRPVTFTHDNFYTRDGNTQIPYKIRNHPATVRYAQRYYADDCERWRTVLNLHK